MSDNYQAVYDAVRSRMSGCDVGRAVEDVLRGENIGHYFQQACYEMQNAAIEHGRPCVVFKPTLTQDGNAWLAVLGDLPTGVVGCGDSPALAMADFDEAWYRKAEKIKRQRPHKRLFLRLNFGAHHDSRPKRR